MSAGQSPRLFIPGDNRPEPLTVSPVPMWADASCQMSFGERAALEGVLSQCKPRLAIEIGTYEGGSLSFLAAHSEHVHTFDLYDMVEDRDAYPNVTFHTGDSKVLLPRLLRALEADRVDVDFVLVDGDHSAEGVRDDLHNLLESAATSSTVIVLHDTMNEETRAGIERVELSTRSKVVYYELDLVPGYEYLGGHFDGQVWGGLGLVVTGDRATSGYGESPRQTRYREPFQLLHRARLIPATLQPVPETSSLPLPPDELIDRVVSGFSNEDAEGHREMFLRTGRQSLEDFEAALAAVGRSFSEHERILEFGCGCGRIMRWMEGLGRTRTLVGTDIDARAIEWASSNLPFARFDVNEGVPPTRYADGEFDLIVNHSVFTHLDERYQDLWLEELHRISRPGALLVLSIHGEHAFHVSEEYLAPGSRERTQWRAQLERDGILFVAEDTYVGSAFPDFYHTAFHAPWYVFQHWSRWFDVLAYLPRSSLGFQDQVVLRRREDAEQPAPIRARPEGAASPPLVEPPAPMNLDLVAPIDAPTSASRFGRPGLAARRAIFRIARPILHAQAEVDRSLAEAVKSLDERVDQTGEQRMPPLVGAVLRQQAERIDRLEAEILELRRAPSRDDGEES